MTDLVLFVDPHDVGYPSTVRELLNETDKRKGNICAAVTPFSKCLLICNNHIYIWSCVATESGIPHGIHMELPPTGLKYTIQLVCLFSKGSNYKHQSLLAVSPEGYLRYWAELGKQPRNEECMLNNEVAHSIQQIDSQEHVNRFLLTTTTGSFHIIDLYHGSNQPDRVATRPLDVGGPGGGIGRRMSLLLFGSLTAEKEAILKTLFVHGKMGAAADVVNVLSRYLRFYAFIEQKTQNHEVDIADLALNKYNKNRERAERRHFRIVDATQFRTGLLLFLVGDKDRYTADDRHQGLAIDREIFLAYYEEPKDSLSGHKSALRTLLKIELSNEEQPLLEAILSDKRLQNAILLCPGQEECCVVFHNSLLFIRHPLNPNSASTLLLAGYQTERTQCQQQGSPNRAIEQDTLLGAAVVHGTCQLMLKESGLCTVRRLPRHYDLNFWKKYRSILNQIDSSTQEATLTSATENRQKFKSAFTDFCAKDMKRAKEELRQLIEQMQRPNESAEHDENGEEGTSRKSRWTRATEQEKQQENLAEMTIDLLLYFLDRQPNVQEDPRWAFSQDQPATNEQKNKLREVAETKKFELIQKQLRIKIAFYKMFVLFLRSFHLIEWINFPMQSFQSRTGKTVVAELGEKLLAADTTFRWFSDHSQSLPLVNRALSELAKQYITRYGLPRSNPFLSSTDYVFNKVSAFHELVSAMVQIGSQALEEEGSNSQQHTKGLVIREVGSLLLILVESVQDAQRTNWILRVEDKHSTWLNQPDFLTHFITHLNAALDFLAEARQSHGIVDELGGHGHSPGTIYEQCVRLAHFVLSQQSLEQRNDSKIIARFASLGHQEVALELAEKYKDFTFLVVHCHKKLDGRRREEALERYKKEYEDDGFYEFLYSWYQQKGMFSNLLAERGKNASDFLEKRQEINWIRQIEEHKYGPARKTLKQMAAVEKDERKKLIELSLCKIAALCEERENVAEIADLSEQIRALHESQQRKESDANQDNDDMITE